jgi:hypothetical protein
MLYHGVEYEDMRYKTGASHELISRERENLQDRETLFVCMPAFGADCRATKSKADLGT